MRKFVRVVLVAFAIGPVLSMGVRCDPEKSPNERARWVRTNAPARGVEGSADASHVGYSNQSASAMRTRDVPQLTGARSRDVHDVA